MTIAATSPSGQICTENRELQQTYFDWFQNVADRFQTEIHRCFFVRIYFIDGLVCNVIVEGAMQ